jgi:hypothetical protein
MDSVPIAAQRVHDGTGPQVAAGTLKQIPMQNTDQDVPTLFRARYISEPLSQNIGLLLKGKALRQLPMSALGQKRT